MSVNAFYAVEEFNNKIIGLNRIIPAPIEDESEFGFLVGCLKEEIEELEEAHGQDFIGEIDAIIDLIYFAMGGLCRMGIPSSLQSRMFVAVHEANMQKALGKKEARDKGHDLDAVKPEGWTPPEEQLANLLEMYKETLKNYARNM